MFESSLVHLMIFTHSFVISQSFKMPRRKNWKRSKAIMGAANPMTKTGDQHSVDDREEESALIYKNRKTNAPCGNTIENEPEESVLPKKQKN